MSIISNIYFIYKRIAPLMLASLLLKMLVKGYLSRPSPREDKHAVARLRRHTNCINIPHIIRQGNSNTELVFKSWSLYLGMISTWSKSQMLCWWYEAKYWISLAYFMSSSRSEHSPDFAIFMIVFCILCE